MAFSKLGLAATLVALAGCTAEGPDEVPADDDVETKRSAYGVVAVERTEGEGLSRASVSAKFMRVSAPERALAEDLVAARAVVPPVGECATLSSLEGLSADRFAASLPLDFAIELLDVGDVTLLLRSGATDQAEPSLLPLSPRAFPDVGDLASGVFYTTPDANLPASTLPYGLSGSGAATVDAFVLDVGAFPESPEDVVVAPELQADGEVSVTWRRPDSEPSEGSLLYIDVLAASAYRCSFADAGAAVLPRGVLVPEDAGSEATISVHRVTERLVPLRRDVNERADEAGEARIRFDLAAAVRVPVK
jgi:hypothetical protein